MVDVHGVSMYVYIYNKFIERVLNFKSGILSFFWKVHICILLKKDESSSNVSAQKSTLYRVIPIDSIQPIPSTNSVIFLLFILDIHITSTYLKVKVIYNTYRLRDYSKLATFVEKWSLRVLRPFRVGYITTRLLPFILAGLSTSYPQPELGWKAHLTRKP